MIVINLRLSDNAERSSSKLDRVLSSYFVFRLSYLMTSSKAIHFHSFLSSTPLLLLINSDS